MITCALLAVTLSAPQGISPTPLSVHVAAGFPWSGVAVEKSFASDFSATIEAETALGRRWESRLQLNKDWPIKTSWLLRSGLGTGWVFQSPSVPRQGVQVVARLGASYQSTYSPFVTLDYRYLIGLRELAIQSATGDRTEWVTTPYVSILGQVGVRRSISSSLELDLRIIFGEIDDVFAIPGALLGLRWSQR